MKFGEDPFEPLKNKTIDTVRECGSNHDMVRNKAKFFCRWLDNAHWYVLAGRVVPAVIVSSSHLLKMFIWKCVKFETLKIVMLKHFRGAWPGCVNFVRELDPISEAFQRVFESQNYSTLLE